MSEDVLLVVDFNSICRFCLQSKGALSGIFDDAEDLSLQFQVTFFTNVEINLDDRLPNKICHKCRYKIELCYQFKEMVLQSHTALIENINEEESSILEEKYDIHSKSNDSIVRKFKEAFKRKHIDHKESLKNFCENEILYDTYVVDKNVGSDFNMIVMKNEDSNANKSEYIDEDISKYLNLNISHNSHKENDESEIHKLKMRKKRDKQLTAKKIKPSIFQLNNYPTMCAASKKNFCLLCLEKCTDVEQLHGHVDKHVEGTDLEAYYKIGDRNITCSACSKTFNYRFTFLTHQREHLGLKPFICHYEGCDNAFSSNTALRQHLPIHGEKEFICSVCAIGFKRKSDLKGHEIIHKDAGKIYRCPICNLTCKNRLTLAAHVKKHGTQPSYKCTLCPKMYFSRSELERHTHRHSPEKRFRCAQCPGAYYSQSALARHERGHRRVRPPRPHAAQDFPFRCLHCQKGYYVKTALHKHVAICELGIDSQLSDVHSLNNDTFIQIDDSMKVYHGEQILDGNGGDPDLIVELIDMQEENGVNS